MTTACLLLLSATYLGQVAAKPEPPTLRKIIRKLPIIDSADGRCRSVELSGRLNCPGEIDLRFRATYRVPGRFSLLVCDGADGTPLFFAVDRNLLIYDPVGPVVYRSTSLTPEFSIGPRKGGDDSFVIGIGASTRKGPARLYCDLRSMLTTVAEGLTGAEEVVRTGGDTYRLTKKAEEGGRGVFGVDLASPFPFTSIEFFGDDEHGPFLSFDRIALDGELKDDEFAFPGEKRLAELIAVENLPAENLLKSLGGLAAVVRAGYVRMAANKPEIRDKLKFPGLLGIDWDRVRENDAKYAGAMRDLIPMASRVGLTPAVPKPRAEDLFTPRFLREVPRPPGT